MFRLYADKNKLALQEREPVTSGSVNVYSAQFGFSEAWEGLERVAVFAAGGTSREVPLGDSGTCVIPWEVLTEKIRRANPHVRLLAGVYGTRGGEIVLPTVWADLGAILEGVPTNGEGASPPTPELWQQELAKKGDRLSYTEDAELGLYSGDKLLSSVPVSGGGEGGTSDHRLLTNRDAEKQHPMASIDGLEEELKRIPAPVEPLTNLELEELLK